MYCAVQVLHQENNSLLFFPSNALIGTYIYSRSWEYKTNFHNYNSNNRLILARHVGWGMRSSYFIRILVKQLQAISETMTDQIVWKVLIALMTDLSADRSISLV